MLLPHAAIAIKGSDGALYTIAHNFCQGANVDFSEPLQAAVFTVLTHLVTKIRKGLIGTLYKDRLEHRGQTHLKVAACVLCSFP